jgi:hypothetical protein
MGLVNNVIDTKYNSQIRNYDTSIGSFSLKANVGDRIQSLIAIEMYWYVEPTAFSIFEDGRRIVIEGEPFDIAGFSHGDDIEVRFGYVSKANNQLATGKIVNVSSDGLTIFTDITTLTNGFYTDIVTGGLPTGDFECLIAGVTSLTNLIYKYNFVPNDISTPSFNSLLTGDLQEYKTSNLQATAVQGVPSSGKRWRNNNDFVQVTKLPTTQIPLNRDVDFGEAGGVVPTCVQNFKVEHRVSVQPYYLAEDIFSMIPPSGQREKPTRLNNSLKHIFSISLKEFINDSNETKTVNIVDKTGSVGWFDENFDGNRNQYELQSITYQDSSGFVDEINIKEETTVTLVVTSEDGTFNGSQTVNVMHSLIPQQEILNDDYFNNNYLYDTVNTSGLGQYVYDVVYDYQTPNQSTITFKVLIGTAAGLNSNDYYLLGITLDDDVKSAELSDRVTLIADVNQYALDTDIPDLLKELSGGLTTNYESNVYTESKGWVQDAVKVEFQYKYDPFTYTENTSIQLVAWKDGEEEDYFVLQDYSIDSANDYQLSQNGIEFHKKNITTSVFDVNQDLIETSSFLNNSLQNYNSNYYESNLNTTSQNEYNSALEPENIKNISLTTRYMWHDWIQLPDAPIFFSKSGELNSGLNKNVSNYSLTQGYSLKWILNADINKGGVITKYIHKVNAEVLDFSVNSDESWVLNTINTYLVDGDYDSNKVLLADEDMRLEIIIDNLVDPLFDLSLYRGSISVETKDPASELQTLEIGTDEFNLFTNSNELKSEYTLENEKGYPLKGISNELYCDIEKVGSSIVLSCILKSSTKYLSKNADAGQICITGRIGLKDDASTIDGEFSDDFSNSFFI